MLGPGEIIEGKYKIVRPIGVGGMGEVYEGENVRIRRRVAIKILHAGAARNKDAVERFEREAQAAGQISSAGSEHILEVLDLGALETGEHFIVMEYLDGETLGKRIEHSGRMTPRELAPIVRQALIGLQAAHGAGIIHRDLKPDNLFVCKEKAGQRDFVKIIDFGISKFHSVGGDMQMTRTGAVMGTPYYMSPEQARGSREIDARSDIYAIGVILYEALSGNKPFVAETFNELMFKIVLSEPPPLREAVPDIDPAFESIVYKAMARDVAHRFASADEFVQALDNWAAGGKAVTIPPEIGHAPATQPGRGRTVPLPAAGIPAATGNNAAWSSTGHDPITIPKSKAPIAIIAGAGALFVVGAISLGAYFVFRHKPASAETPPAPSGAELAAAIPEPPAESAAPPPAPASEPSQVRAAAAPSVGAPVASVAPTAPTTPTERPPLSKTGKIAVSKAVAEGASKPATDSKAGAKTAPLSTATAKPIPTDFGY